MSRAFTRDACKIVGFPKVVAVQKCLIYHDFRQSKRAV
jgi:hypothetical protein